VQRYLGVEVNGALSTKAKPVFCQRDMPGIAAVEILAQGLRYPRADSLSQSIAQIEVFP
jgi:hypothetical protein